MKPVIHRAAALPALGSGLRSPHLLAAGVLVCAALLTGCRLSPAASSPAHHPGRTGTGARVVTGHVAAPVSSGGGSVAEQVASGWLAAMAAFQSAARSADANEPALLATTVGPMLAVETSYLRQMQASGELAVGPTADLGTPTVAVVSPRLATVTDCVYDAEVAVDRATGQPVVGLAGQVEHERFSSVMERTTTGWELAEQTAVEVTACPAS